MKGHVSAKKSLILMNIVINTDCLTVLLSYHKRTVDNILDRWIITAGAENGQLPDKPFIWLISLKACGKEGYSSFCAFFMRNLNWYLFGTRNTELLIVLLLAQLRE